jgi:hypothetical protein
MQWDGACPITFRAGFFNYGFNFYSNGVDAYCSCDRGLPPGAYARPVHRRPDMRYDGSCGGC